MHGKIKTLRSFFLGWVFNLMNFSQQLNITVHVSMSSAKFLLVCSLLHHVLSEPKVYFLCRKLGTFTKSNLPQTNALLICILSLLGLLQFTMHISFLFIDCTNQIWII